MPQTNGSGPGCPDTTEESSQENFIHLDSSSITHTRSNMESCVPRGFDDYAVEGKYKYRIEKTVNYSHLPNETKCFVPNHNTTIKP